MATMLVFWNYHYHGLFHNEKELRVVGYLVFILIPMLVLGFGDRVET
jgi:hypothetical protein